MSTLQWVSLFVLTAFIHTVNTGAYAARLAGVRTGRPTLARSLYNLLALSSRGANALLGPLVASLTDLAVNGHDTAQLLLAYRWMLGAATVGTAVAGALIPSLSRGLARGIASYEVRHSLPRVVVHGVTVRGLWRARDVLRRPSLTSVRRSRRSPFRKRFLLASVAVTALYTVTNFSTMYASALVPQGVRTATSLSPLLTGLGALLTIFFIDPVAAIVVDEALRGERPLHDVTYISIWQIGARLLGTLVAQVLLVPTAWGIAWLTAWLVGLR